MDINEDRGLVQDIDSDDESDMRIKKKKQIKIMICQ